MNENVKKELKEIRRHLSAGFNGMLPLVIVGALGMALSSIFPAEGVFGELFTFLGDVGLNKYDIFVAMMIGQSLSGKPGMASAFILGLYSNSLELGIFGGIVVGFISGYAGVFFNKLKIEGSTKALLALVVVPTIVSITGFFIIKFIIGVPIAWLQTTLIATLTSISGTSSVLLGVVLGLMFGFDLGGPINKIGGMFALITLSEGIRGPMTFAAAAYMLPSMAAGLATILGRKKEIFDEDEIQQGPTVFALGLFSLSEPALPMMFSDMKFMVPVNMICSALLCGLFSFFKIESALALGFLSFFFMNHILLGVIIFLGCLFLLTSLILWRRKSLYKSEVLD